VKYRFIQLGLALPEQVIKESNARLLKTLSEKGDYVNKVYSTRFNIEKQRKFRISVKYMFIQLGLALPEQVIKESNARLLKTLSEKGDPHACLCALNRAKYTYIQQ